MAEVSHLPANCSVADIIKVVERDGAAIVDDFVQGDWLERFNSQIATAIDEYET